MKFSLKKSAAAIFGVLLPVDVTALRYEQCQGRLVQVPCRHVEGCESRFNASECVNHSVFMWVYIRACGVPAPA